MMRPLCMVIASCLVSLPASAINSELDALNQLCRKATASGDYEDAAAVCRRARFDASKLAPGSSEHIASIVNEAELKVILNNHPDAVALYGYAVTLVERRKPGTVEAAELLAHKAESQIYRGKNYEAEVILRRALQIREKVQGPEAFDTSVTRVRYGDVLGFLQQPFESHFAYVKSLVAFEKGGIAAREQYLRTRLRIAELLSRQLRFEEAASEFNRLLQDSQAAPLVSSYSTVALDRLAWISANRGKIEEAIDFYNRELAELQANSGSADQIALVMERIGSLRSQSDARH